MDPRRAIPAVEKLLASAPFAGLVAETHRPLLLDLLHDILTDTRAAIERGDLPEYRDGVEEWYASRVRTELAALQATTLRPVINATGVILHTNLGRAPLANAAVTAMQRVAGSYATLEYNVRSGNRGSRYDHCARLLKRLTGAGDAVVVNNTAAALVLALNTFSRGRSVVISRGELVEIGGAFRVPDIMSRSGARMREVGSTNRTHAQDYQDAIDARTAMLLKVHHSNFRIEGFTSDVPIVELSAIARAAGLPLMYDLGSGLLDDAHAALLPGEPTAREALADGADIVTFSGDKLLGGPQSGILLGSTDAIAAMRRNPLCRALRVDKLTLAALEATLALHLNPEHARSEIPVLHMLAMPYAVLHERATTLAARLAAEGCAADVVEGMSAVGGGAAPGAQLPTALVRLLTARPSAATLARRLRQMDEPVIVRIDDDRVLIDPRTVMATDEDRLVRAVVAAGRQR